MAIFIASDYRTGSRRRVAPPAGLRFFALMAALPRLRFLRQVLRLAGPYWSSERKWRVRGVALLLFALTGAQVGLTVWGNYWNRHLFDELEARSVRGVLVQAGVFALIFLISIAITAAHLLVKRRLQLDWRAWLTERLLDRWMEAGRHYRLRFVPGEHDNPDQRIADDIRTATESAVALAHTFVYSLLTLGLFVEILWTVSGSITVGASAIQIPGYMVPLAFLYAGVGTALGYLLGGPLVRSTNLLQTAEANFRFGLARARERSEAIALVRGEASERRGAAQRFARIVSDWDRQSLAYMGLASFGTGYGGLLPVFPLLIAAPQYIAGAMSLGALMQAAQAFQRLTSALSWPVDNVGEIANWRTSAGRVLSLDRAIQELDAEERAPSHHRIALEQSRERRLVFDDLCIADASGLILLEHWSAEIRRGERVLISGDPALTSSLVKVIGGLWPWGSGRVSLPMDGAIHFVPQRPPLPEGTLHDVLCYPRPPDGFSDAEVRRALECTGLGWLARRLDERADWEQSLPLRAQQQLGIARVLLQQPAWVFLEEATNAFDPKGERLIVEMLQRELPNAALLLISFHPGLAPMFPRKLVLTRLREKKHLFEVESLASH
jgi:putative ATP-binding cassette transporter